MKYPLIFFLVALLGISSIPRQTRQNETYLLQSQAEVADSILYALFPLGSQPLGIFDTTYFPTTLNQEDIANLDTVMLRAIKLSSNFLENRSPLETDLDSINLHFRRQYVPAVSKTGEKFVWINCFCGEREGWRMKVIDMDDKWDCFFSLTINLTRQTTTGVLRNPKRTVAQPIMLGGTMIKSLMD